MKKILLALIMLPAIANSQGLFVATSSSNENIESNMGSITKATDNIVVSSITIDDTTIGAINDDVKQFVNVYPNPASSTITIESEFDRIEIFDATGKHIESKYSLQNKQVNIGHLEKGLYIFSIFKDSQYIHSSKIYKL